MKFCFRLFPLVIIPLICVALGVGSPCARPVTVLAPSEPSVEEDTKKQPKKDDRPAEVDLLISMLNSGDLSGIDMDMPQMFAVLVQNMSENGNDIVVERRDLLGDVEEIRSQNKKAWGANVALEKPGLYQFIMEAKPWWNEAKKVYQQQLAKVILPVFGVAAGWNLPAGQSFEILPLTRPFGLTAPAFFNGRVILNGKPCENVSVHMGVINMGKRNFPTDWHRTMAAVSDSLGQFSFVLNQQGWWFCEATLQADPLKGPDGEPRPVLLSAILWIYVDGMEKTKGK